MLFLKFISKYLLLQDLALAVLQNRLGVYCRQLTVGEGEDLRLQGIQGILVHFLSVLQQLEGTKTLMQPLIGLMKQPQQYAVGSTPHLTSVTSCLCAMVYLLAFQTKVHRFDFLLNQSYRQEYTVICSRFHTTPNICNELPLCNGFFVQWFIFLLCKLRFTDLIFYSTSLTDRNIQQYAVGSTPHLTSVTSCLCAMVYLLAFQTKGHRFDFLLHQSDRQEYTAICSRFHTTPYICSGLPLCNGLSSCFSN